jgi:TRAP-type C4-dicarboxylate transport system permease small subunit
MLERCLALALRLETGVTALARLAAWVAALAVAAITGLLVVSSIKRYLFSNPIPETEELTSLLFLAMGLLAIPYGLARNRHVRIELAWQRFPIRWRSGLEALGLAIGALAVALLVRETWQSTLFGYDIGARTDMNEIRIWPWQAMLPFGLGLFAAALTARALVLALRLATGRIDEERADAGDLPMH